MDGVSHISVCFKSFKYLNTHSDRIWIMLVFFNNVLGINSGTWLNQPDSIFFRLQYRKGTLISNTALAINKMSNIFNMAGLRIRFTGKTPSLVFVNKLFSNDAFKSSWNKITLDGIEFNSEIVNFFLNMADPFKEFQICHSDMPLDFKHKNVSFW